MSITENAYRRTLEEAAEDFLTDIPIQPISPEAASLILSHMAEDTPLVTTVWPYTDFPVWNIETLKSHNVQNTTVVREASDVKRNTSNGLLKILSPDWRQQKTKNANISKDSTLRVGGKMKNGVKVRVEVYTHFEQRSTHDAFGVVRGSIEPGTRLCK